jgi:hypothetical protein
LFCFASAQEACRRADHCKNAKLKNLLADGMPDKACPRSRPVQLLTGSKDRLPAGRYAPANSTQAVAIPIKTIAANTIETPAEA